MRRGRLTGHESIKHSNQRRFLAAFAVSCSVQKAARIAKIHRQTHYDWLAQDPTYSARFEEAKQRAVDSLHDEAVRRAHQGVSRPVLYQGEPVYVLGQPLVETSYSDALLISLLKAHDPARFRDRQQTDVEWNGDLKKLTEAQLEKMFDQMLEKIAKDDPQKAAEFGAQRLASL